MQVDQVQLKHEINFLVRVEFGDLIRFAYF